MPNLARLHFCSILIVLATVANAQKKKTTLAPIAQDNKVQIIPENMTLVHGGTFTMGDMFAEGSSDELPTHSVAVSDFLLGKTEVTFDEFDAFCSATGRDKPSDAGWGRGARPVINIDWYDAIEYCNWLSRQEGLPEVYTLDKKRKDSKNNNQYDDKKWIVKANWGAKGYRLPTEAEWEYAAREGGKKLRFGNGKDLADPGQINFDASEYYKKTYSLAGEYRQKTVPVGEIPGSRNNLELRHITGNVWELCWDWYDENYYRKSTVINPTGPVSGMFRVARGGSWDNFPKYVRCAARSKFFPNGRQEFLGFRVARGY